MFLSDVQAVFVMNDRGELQGHQLAEGTALDETALDLLAHVYVANNAIATMKAPAWEASPDSRGFFPIDGLTLIGMEWSAITAGNVGVVVGTAGADYESAYKLLNGQEAAV